ncbi:hypothetical protein CROQUDRAFT_715019 [Cronartium quercuum f. sp. fusiforme G11]|uniref:Uncharacterized protein n=1 Tax=Cronartium quercuum f. sp. fusiforme G11 TaxID=708437 RepID=A0A9P6NL58_9BASI|nr:hypothetical protein CROQUDRAFT_715019 [Cronartium quercuum f. sp. fusiforme G11]
MLPGGLSTLLHAEKAMSRVGFEPTDPMFHEHANSIMSLVQVCGLATFLNFAKFAPSYPAVTAFSSPSHGSEPMLDISKKLISGEHSNSGQHLLESSSQVAPANELDGVANSRPGNAGEYHELPLGNRVDTVGNSIPRPAQKETVGGETDVKAKVKKAWHRKSVDWFENLWTKIIGIVGRHERDQKNYAAKGRGRSSRPSIAENGNANRQRGVGISSDRKADKEPKPEQGENGHDKLTPSALLFEKPTTPVYFSI